MTIPSSVLQVKIIITTHLDLLVFVFVVVTMGVDPTTVGGVGGGVVVTGGVNGADG